MVSSVDSVSGPDDDVRTFGPSESNREVLELMVSQGHFKTLIGAFQAAAMLALSKQLDFAQAPPSAGTMWSRSSVNPRLLEFLSWYVPTEAPVRTFAQLGNAGTAHVADRVRFGGRPLSEIFDLRVVELD